MENELVTPLSTTTAEEDETSYEPLFDFDRMYSGLLEED